MLSSSGLSCFKLISGRFVLTGRGKKGGVFSILSPRPFQMKTVEETNGTVPKPQLHQTKQRRIAISAFAMLRSKRLELLHVLHRLKDTYSPVAVHIQRVTKCNDNRWKKRAYALEQIAYLK